MSDQTAIIDHTAQAQHAIDLCVTLEALCSVDPEDWDPSVLETLEDHGLDPETDELDLFAELLDGSVLEIYARRETGTYRNSITEYVLLTGTGGPHTEAYVVPDSGRVSAGSWSWFESDKVKLHSPTDCPNLARVLEDIGAGEHRA
jgi:hypothetical protein